MDHFKGRRPQLVDDPFGLGIETGKARRGDGVLHIALLVPDHSCDIELVVQDARAAEGVAADGGVAPGPPAWAGNLFSIELARDGDRARSGGELGEDAAHDGRLGLVDPAPAAHRLALGVNLTHDIIAVGVAATRPAGTDATLEAAPGLLGQVLEEEGIHGAFEPDMQLADLALGNRDEPNAAEAELLIEGCHVFLVARQPVEGLGDDDVEGSGPGVLQELLVPATRR